MRITTKILISLCLLLLFGTTTLKAQNAAFFGSNVASGPLMLSNGWTLLQEIIPKETCVIGGDTCTLQACTVGDGECIAPTTAGSVWVLVTYFGSSANISSVSGGGGSWQTCPANNCAVWDAGTGLGSDLAYNLSGGGGTDSGITVTMSANISNYWVVGFAEFMPPAGYTASYDTSGTEDDSACTTTCHGVGLTLGGTDVIYQFQATNPNLASGGKPWSGAYFSTAALADGVALNATSGTQPTFATVGGSTGSTTSAIAFKSSAGNFTFTGSTAFTLTNYTLPTGGTQVSCNATSGCALTIPSTTSGDLLVLVEGDTGSNGYQISSVTGGGTWVVPSGAGTCNANAHVSCAYTLSATGSTTSITVKTAGTSTTVGFQLYQFHRASGSWTLDAQSANANVNTAYPTGAAVSCTGTNDVRVDAIAASGGVSAVTSAQVGFYPSAALNALTASPYDPSASATLNTANCTAATFPFEGGNSLNSEAFSIMFD